MSLKDYTSAPFSPKDRIELELLLDDPTIPKGTKGTVDTVTRGNPRDGVRGTDWMIFVCWDNGVRFPILVPPDKARRIR